MKSLARSHVIKCPSSTPRSSGSDPEMNFSAPCWRTSHFSKSTSRTEHRASRRLSGGAITEDTLMGPPRSSTVLHGSFVDAFPATEMFQRVVTHGRTDLSQWQLCMHPLDIILLTAFIAMRCLQWVSILCLLCTRLTLKVTMICPNASQCTCYSSCLSVYSTQIAQNSRSMDRRVIHSNYNRWSSRLIYKNVVNTLGVWDEWTKT